MSTESLATFIVANASTTASPPGLTADDLRHRGDPLGQDVAELVLRGRCQSRHHPVISRQPLHDPFWHYRYVATLIERLAQAAYEAHRAVLPAPLPPWEELTKQEQQAWKAAASAVAGQTGTTIPEGPDTPPLVIQVADQRHIFHTDFTAGREGSLVIEDDFASIHHARFQTVRGVWYVNDLDSTNGTVLNGRRIHGPQLLSKRDKVRIGHTIMTVVSA
jgi:FHA domain